MKRIVLLVVLLPVFLQAKVPDWILNTPKNSLYYWGIGACDLSDANYEEVAKREALEEIIQQISVKVESSSFMNMREIDFVAYEDYQKKIQSSSHVYIEDLQIFDTYQDKKKYYVCYRLNKEEYKTKIKAKSQEIAKSAYDYLQKARNAESEGNIVSAIVYYQKGLEVAEPWLFLDLFHMEENVPVELFSGYMSVFDGLTLTLQQDSVTIENLKTSNVEIVAILHKNDIPLYNIPLRAQFVSGAGKVTPSTRTNNIGEGKFFLNQIINKEASQCIKISVDDAILKDLPQIYQNNTTSQKLPEALFRVNIEKQKIVFYINPINNGIQPLLRQVASILSSEYFEVTTNPFEATHVMDISTDLRKTGSVTGDLENLDEWLASLNIALRDKKGVVLTHYSEEGVRILVSKDSSQSNVIQQTSKELMKRFKRKFPKQLENISFP